MIRFLILSYGLASLLIMIYGLNCHLMVYLFERREARRRQEDRELLDTYYRDHGNRDLPTVTTQLPIYNEMNVAERLIDAVAAFDYPRELHEIQVLDDSSDATRLLVAKKVAALRQQGMRIEHITRSRRKGFKAGALKHGMRSATGDILAIFDADFVPPPDFLQRGVPYFAMDEKLGLVQARWGHLNADSRLLTRLQAIGIDGHFMIEQSARNYNDLFMNFNGTAGLFRKRAIIDAGGWHEDTLTEDMDLSYRMQLQGWQCRYLVDLVTPAEIPSSIAAFKSQQFRWAKGSIQTAFKLLPRVWKTDSGLNRKMQATLHMTHYLVHPLMAYLAVMAPVLLWTASIQVGHIAFSLFAGLLLLSCTGPSRLYWTAERCCGVRRGRRIALLPLLIGLGCGLAVNNSRAVLEAVFGHRGDFIRTPKHGDQPRKSYLPIRDAMFVPEIVLGLWCLLGLYWYASGTQYLVGFFLAVYSAGFLSVGILSLREYRKLWTSAAGSEPSSADRYCTEK